MFSEVGVTRNNGLPVVPGDYAQIVPRAFALTTSFQAMPRISKKSRDLNSHFDFLFVFASALPVRFAMEESSPLLHKATSKSRRESGCSVPCRYVLAALSCSGFCVVYLLRVNLSVALVAMVNSTYANEKASSNNPECQRNSSSTSKEKVRTLTVSKLINNVACLLNSYSVLGVEICLRSSNIH